MSLAYLKRTSCRSVLTGLAVLMILSLPACRPVFSHPPLFTRPHPVFRRAEKKQNPHKHLLHCLYFKPVYGCHAAGMDFGRFLSFLRENSMFFRKVPLRFFDGWIWGNWAFVCLHIYSHPQSSIYPPMMSTIFIIKLYCARNSFSHWRRDSQGMCSQSKKTDKNQRRLILTAEPSR